MWVSDWLRTMRTLERLILDPAAPRKIEALGDEFASVVRAALAEEKEDDGTGTD